MPVKKKRNMSCCGTGADCCGDEKALGGVSGKEAGGGNQESHSVSGHHCVPDPPRTSDQEAAPGRITASSEASAEPKIGFWQVGFATDNVKQRSRTPSAALSRFPRVRAPLQPE